jgi:orotate phosphoribosyltransferase
MMNTDLLLNIKKIAYLEGDFVTRAGKKTNYYIDKYLFETEPSILAPLSIELAKLFPNKNSYDRIAAPELGAVPIAAVVSTILNKPFIIVKKQSKEYGTQNMIEGKYEAGEKVIILEDILTTGGAALRALEVLKKANLDAKQIIGVVDREEGARENIEKLGLIMTSLFTKTDLQNC